MNIKTEEKKYLKALCQSYKHLGVIQPIVKADLPNLLKMAEKKLLKGPVTRDDLLCLSTVSHAYEQELIDLVKSSGAEDSQEKTEEHHSLLARLSYYKKIDDLLQRDVVVKDITPVVRSLIRDKKGARENFNLMELTYWRQLLISSLQRIKHFRGPLSSIHALEYMTLGEILYQMRKLVDFDTLFRECDVSHSWFSGLIQWRHILAHIERMPNFDLLELGRFEEIIAEQIVEKALDHDHIKPAHVLCQFHRPKLASKALSILNDVDWQVACQVKLSKASVIRAESKPSTKLDQPPAKADLRDKKTLLKMLAKIKNALEKKYPDRIKTIAKIIDKIWTKPDRYPFTYEADGGVYFERALARDCNFYDALVDFKQYVDIFLSQQPKGHHIIFKGSAYSALVAKWNKLYQEILSNDDLQITGRLREAYGAQFSQNDLKKQFLHDFGIAQSKCVRASQYIGIRSILSKEARRTKDHNVLTNYLLASLPEAGNEEALFVWGKGESSITSVTMPSGWLPKGNAAENEMRQYIENELLVKPDCLAKTKGSNSKKGWGKLRKSLTAVYHAIKSLAHLSLKSDDDSLQAPLMISDVAAKLTNAFSFWGAAFETPKKVILQAMPEVPDSPEDQLSKIRGINWHSSGWERRFKACVLTCHLLRKYPDVSRKHGDLFAALKALRGVRVHGAVAYRQLILSRWIGPGNADDLEKHFMKLAKSALVDLFHRVMGRVKTFLWKSHPHYSALAKRYQKGGNTDEISSQKNMLEVLRGLSEIRVSPVKSRTAFNKVKKVFDQTLKMKEKTKKSGSIMSFKV